jgi:hypothetical protein
MVEMAMVSGGLAGFAGMGLRLSESGSPVRQISGSKARDELINIACKARHRPMFKAHLIVVGLVNEC